MPPNRSASVGLASLAVVFLAACRPGQPCPSCEDAGDDGDETADIPDVAEPIPDLPCDGADLQTDDDNCGECGNECWVNGAGDYRVGGCVDGACGPVWWGKQWLGPDGSSCADVCAETGLSCRADACAGLTGFVCEAAFDAPCDTFTFGSAPFAEVTGSCTEPIDWPEQALGQIKLYCCCG